MNIIYAIGPLIPSHWNFKSLLFYRFLHNKDVSLCYGYIFWVTLFLLVILRNEDKIILYWSHREDFFSDTAAET